MANKWFKFYGAEYLGDPKTLSLSPAARSCWLTLLCYASLTDGVIEFLTEENLMIQSGLSIQKDEWDETRGVMDKFVKMRMIEVVDDKVFIKNWSKRQDVNLTGYERVKKYRMKQNDNAMITSEEIRLDKNREEENRSSSFKKEKRFFRGQEMRFAQNKWWVLPKGGGEWLEFAGSLKETQLK